MRSSLFLAVMLVVLGAQARAQDGVRESVTQSVRDDVRRHLQEQVRADGANDRHLHHHEPETHR